MARRSAWMLLGLTNALTPLHPALADTRACDPATQARIDFIESRLDTVQNRERWWFVAPLVPMAVFAWLSESNMAWVAIGFIGVAAILAGTAITLRKG